jgi:hypothetical protein
VAHQASLTWTRRWHKCRIPACPQYTFNELICDKDLARLPARLRQDLHDTWRGGAGVLDPAYTRTLRVAIRVATPPGASTQWPHKGPGRGPGTGYTVCHLPSCDVQIARGRFMCPEDWARVPRELQAALWASWQSSDGVETPQYQDAAAAAIRAACQAASGHGVQDLVPGATYSSAYWRWPGTSRDGALAHRMRRLALLAARAIRRASPAPAASTDPAANPRRLQAPERRPQ